MFISLIDRREGEGEGSQVMASIKVWKLSERIEIEKRKTRKKNEDY